MNTSICTKDLWLWKFWSFNFSNIEYTTLHSKKLEFARYFTLFCPIRIRSLPVYSYSKRKVTIPRGNEYSWIETLHSFKYVDRALASPFARYNGTHRYLSLAGICSRHSSPFVVAIGSLVTRRKKESWSRRSCCWNASTCLRVSIYEFHLNFAISF